MAKLIKLPTAKVFPCLDLYRIFLLHPDSVCHWKKYETGGSNLYTLLGPLTDPLAGDPAKMCALRCVSNLFREQTAVYILREKATKTIDCIKNHLANPKANVRNGVLTILLNYSVIQLQKDDHDLRMTILGAFNVYKSGVSSETDDANKKLMQAAVQNLTYKNYEAKKLAKELNLIF
jgi:hypothetical protein